MRILLVTPPLTQLNTPYPATPYLSGFLCSRGYNTAQQDLGIELIDSLFTKEKLAEVFSLAGDKGVSTHSDSKMLACQDRYLSTVDQVVNFLRGNDLSLATLIARSGFLPEGERFKHVADLEYSFGDLGVTDRAKHLATLYLEDISDFIRRTIDPHFELIRYAESLCVSLPSFDTLEERLCGEQSFIDELILDIFSKRFILDKPTVVGLSVPFPGNLYAALLVAKWIKTNHPEVKVLLGGGYVSTELRSIFDPRLFSYIDYLLFDDGEISILRLLEHFEEKCGEGKLVRTAFLKEGKVFFSGNEEENIAGSERATPLFSQLPLSKYISLVEVANPMLKLWSDGRWNKLILAHGCYWAKCAFCDVTLDYIRRYEPYDAFRIVDMMEEVIAQTGQTGFHFVDEAAPPALLKRISLEIIKRGLTVSWWANVRFEYSFTRDLCLLMARAGCIAVSGGLEVASDRLLTLMHKGVDLKQATTAASAFSSANIMVHAYLMYGFPSETLQETIDSLEVVRQLFEQNLVQSAFWHRFAMTVHSPVGCHPEQYGAKRTSCGSNPFANNEVYFKDGTNTDLVMLGEGLRKATYNYMHGVALDKPLNTWFEEKVPRCSIPSTLIAGYLITPKNDHLPNRGWLVSLADGFQLKLTDSRKPKLYIFNQSKHVEVVINTVEVDFWEVFFDMLKDQDGFWEISKLRELVLNQFPGGEEAFITSKVWKSLRKNGLAVS